MPVVADPQDPSLKYFDGGGSTTQSGPTGPGPASGAYDYGLLYGGLPGRQSQLPLYGGRKLQYMGDTSGQTQPLQFQGGGSVNYGTYGPSPQMGGMQRPGFGSINPYGQLGGAAPMQQPAQQPMGGGGNNPFTDTGRFNAAYGVNSILAGGYGSGAFNPGMPSWLGDYAKYLTGQGAGDVHKAEMGAELYNPDDPLAGSYARMNAEQSARDRISTALSGAYGQAGQQQNQNYWNLLQSYGVPSATGAAPSTAPRQQGGGLGGMLGGIAGTFLGGPGGGALGGALGHYMFGGGH
jgi:hypothetical protein